MKKSSFLVVSLLFILVLSGCGGGPGGGTNTPTPVPTADPTPPPGPELAVDANTVALWHFNENTGTTALDSSSNHRDLTFSASPKDPAWVVDSGRTSFGSCLILDNDSGASDNASWITSDTDLSFSGNQFTIECWIKLDSLSSGSGTTIFDCTTFWLEINSFGRIILAIQDVDGGVTRMVTTDGSDTSPDKVKINTGSWYYVAATHSPTDKVKIYINGILQQSMGDTEFPVISSPYEYSFAKSFYATHNCITGMLDDVRISNIVRSGTEIANYYQQVTE